MSALDQAFIKAYMQHAPSAAGTTMEPSRPVSLAAALDASPVARRSKQAPAPESEDDVQTLKLTRSENSTEKRSTKQPHSKTKAVVAETHAGASRKKTTAVIAEAPAEKSRSTKNVKAKSAKREEESSRPSTGPKAAPWASSKTIFRLDSAEKVKSHHCPKKPAVEVEQPRSKAKKSVVVEPQDAEAIAEERFPAGLPRFVAPNLDFSLNEKKPEPEPEEPKPVQISDWFDSPALAPMSSTPAPQSVATLAPQAVIFEESPRTVETEAIASAASVSAATTSALAAAAAAAQAPIVEEKIMPALAPETDRVESACEDSPAPCVGSANSSSASCRIFQPMLQVDHFNWPKAQRELEDRSPEQIESLAEALIAMRSQNQRVIAVSGMRTGEGATTLLLAAGRNLARRGLKIALVDADWRDPQLAARLGLLPQCGWEDVLFGNLPLEEALVESIADRLAALPVRSPILMARMQADAMARLAASWETLGEQFDITLVDLGSLSASPMINGMAAMGDSRGIEGLILAHDARSPLPASWNAWSQALASAGIAVGGVVENFC